MRRVLVVILIAVLLTGCMNPVKEMDRAIALREKLLSSDGCSFDAVISADYGEKVYTFSMRCQSDKSGNLSFTVTDPETISGITGSISQEGGKLTFDDRALAFELLADGQVTPVSAPWLLIRTLRSGYLTACGSDEDLLRISIDDSYADNALYLDIWVDENNLPLRGEILWQGRRIVSLHMRNFTFM